MNAGNKIETWESLSQDYYLTSKTSKADNVNYLKSYIYTPTIFMMKRCDMKLASIPSLSQNKMVSELLDILEDILQNEEIPKTGLSYITLPDEEWIFRDLMYVDPLNRYGIFGLKQELKAILIRNIIPCTIFTRYVGRFEFMKN